MPGMSAHAKPSVRRDYLLPALALIVACGLLEVWASWLTIGSVSGFPKLGRMTTGWILPVTTEAYWTVALFAWLVSPAGPRSRRFAMRTAIGMFVLSLTGQEAGHLIAVTLQRAPLPVVGLVTALPLISVGLGAILIHLRQADKEERAEADEQTALRAELEAARNARDEADNAREIAGQEAAVFRAQMEAMAARVETLTRKLAEVSGEKRRQNPRRRGASPVARTTAPGPAASSQNQAPTAAGTGGEVASEPVSAPVPELAATQNQEPVPDAGEQDGRKLTLDELVVLARQEIAEYAAANGGKRISWEALGKELGVAKATAGEVLKEIARRDAMSAADLGGGR